MQGQPAEHDNLKCLSLFALTEVDCILALLLLILSHVLAINGYTEVELYWTIDCV